MVFEMKKIRILIVEDERIIAEDLQQTLTDPDYDVLGTINTGEDAIRLAGKLRPDLVLMDIVLKGKIDGIDAADQILSQFDIPVVYLSAYVDAKRIKRAKKTNPYGYILKPYEEKELKAVIEMALYKHQLEQKVKQSEQFLNAVFESIQDGISVLHTDLTIRHVNGVMNKWYQGNVPLEGKKCYECYHDAKKPCNPCPTLKCIQSGKTEREIVTGLHGSPVEWIELFSYPIKNSDTGEVTGIVEFVRDITEQKRAEEALIESESRYRSLIEGTHDMVQSVDPDGKFVFINRAWSEVMGYRIDELSNRTLFDIIHPDSLSYCRAIFSRIMCGESISAFKAIFVTKKGEKVWVEGNAGPRFLRDKIISTQGFFRNITDRGTSD